MNDFDASIVSCKDYSEENVKSAVKEAIDAVGGLDFVKPGMKIAIKPNLVSTKKPEAAVTTHPMLLKVLCDMLLECGAQVMIGDSPGGPFTAAGLSRAYTVTGLSELVKPGISLNKSTAQCEADFPEGKMVHSFQYIEFLKDADAIIDVCKLKTHGMLGMTAAVKNLYGTIPGLMKPEMHYQFPGEADFSDMLIDLNEFFKPRLTLVDAVMCMEGNGPTAGTPRYIGAVVASKKTYYADLVNARLINMDITGLPTLKAAYDRGLAPDDYRKLNVYGDVESFVVHDFKAPPVAGLNFMRKGTFLHAIASRALAHKPKVHKELCIGCGKCSKICPAHAITMKHNYPVINRKKCIRCFCCQEFCPKAAMQVHRPLPARILNKVKKKD